MKFRHQRALEEFREKSGSYYDKVDDEDEVLFMICFLPQFDINKYSVGRVLSDRTYYSFGIRGYATITSPYSIYKPKRNMLRIDSAVGRTHYDYFYRERLLVITEPGIMIKI